MLKVTYLKVANEISSLQFKLAPSAWCEISLVISIHVIFLHLAYVDNQDCKQRHQSEYHVVVCDTDVRVLSVTYRGDDDEDIKVTT